MSVHSANAAQTIEPGGSAVFTTTLVHSPNNFVRHRDGTGSFLLSGAVPCRCKRYANYVADFGANIAVAEGGTVGPISVAFALDGSVIPASEMVVTPAAVGEFFNISRQMSVDVWAGCCETFTIINTSTTPITMENALIDIDRK